MSKELSKLQSKLKQLKKELKELERDLEDRKEDIDSFSSEFDEFLDDTFGDVEIVGNTYGAGWALKKLDPIAYDEELSNWVDANIDDLILYDSKAKDIIGEIDAIIVKIENVEEEIQNLKD